MSVSCTILMGPLSALPPMPVPAKMTEALKKVEVIHNDNERSGFQLNFALGRDKSLGQVDYPLLKQMQIKPFNRVMVLTTWKGILQRQRIMDGVITHLQINPGDQPGSGELVITGEDISVVMDQEEKVMAYPGQNDTTIVEKIIRQYAQYGLTANVITPAVMSTPDPERYMPMQHGTDWAYLKFLARRYGYIFYVDTGNVNTAYWGPLSKSGSAQSPLSINLGPQTNAVNVRFQYKVLAPATYTTQVQDAETNQVNVINIQNSTRPALAREAALQQHKRILQLAEVHGLTASQAQALAQARTDTSTDNAISAEGDLDVMRYGRVLEARKLVEVRGAGNPYNGKYYVKQVKHILQPGQYKQTFLLTREGTGALTNRIAI